MSATSPPDSAPAHTNRLAQESSPYLLQHAHNPVDWYPWGPEAFEEARRRQVPILLSVGYSTCYWCHVMERESFENEAIAQQMNEQFVCIKLDREERPDVDDVYMTALQLLTRSGGWPLNAFLTPPGAEGEDDPGLRPFFAGTYFPPDDSMGRPGFPAVLTNISHAWNNQRDQVFEQAGKLTEAVREQLGDEGKVVRVDERQISEAMETLLRIHDRDNGGFGGSPKFPQPVYAEFLLDTRTMVTDPAVRTQIDEALRRTLDKMATGGIHDQVGGGFHRYAVDAEWVVPHFEKMLYDNGQLASLYAKSFLFDRDPYDAEVLRGILEYVRREMTAPGGPFYSAQDAEVDGREGLNYVWTPEEIDLLLTESDAAFTKDVFGLNAGTNFQDPHHPEADATNVLVLRMRPEALALALGMEDDEFATRLASVRSKMLAARDQRKQPRLDDKLLVSWNGLMIAGFAHGALALGDLTYLDNAERAARAILNDMRTDDGGLLRVARLGVAKEPAILEDYAFFVQGLLAIHRVNAASLRGDLTYINAATELTEFARRTFADPDTGVWYDTREGKPDLLVRVRSAYDGATPSASSVMLHNLIELHELTGKDEYLETAKRLAASLSVEIERSPLATVNSVRALGRLMAMAPEFAGELGQRQEEELREAPVQILAAVERVRVPKEGPAGTITLRVQIDEGYHITAREPGVPGLYPFTIRVDGNPGVEAVTAYPEGAAYTGSAIEEGGTMMVYEGTFDIEVTLQRTGEPWQGRALLVVEYQACTDEACLAPVAVELDLAIDP